MTALAGSYGWAGLGLILLASIGVFGWWVYRQEVKARALQAAQSREADAERKAKEYEQVAEVRRRDLGPLPGIRVRDRDKAVQPDSPPGP